MERPMARRATFVALMAAIVVAGCNVQRNVWQAGIPGTATPFTVTRARIVNGYLEAWITGPAAELHTFTPPSEDCMQVLRPEQHVDYVATTAYGRFTHEGVGCDAIGIGSLRQWRDRRPSQTTVVMSPRAQADFRVDYEGEDQIFLRGRFPLARLVGFVSLDDVMAVVPNQPACRQAIQGGVASMQYYQSGPQVLALLAGDQLCPITGLIQPLSPKDPGF